MAEDQPLSSRTESFLTEVAVFLGKFFSTLRVLVFFPSRLAAAYLENRGASELWVTPPLTFLVSSAFLFAIVFSFVITGRFEWDGDHLFAYLSDEIGTQISILQVFLLTLPIAAVVLLSIYIIDLLMQRGAEGRLARVTFLSYVPSFGMFCMFFLVFMKGVHDLLLNRRIDENSLRHLTENEQIFSTVLLLSSISVVVVAGLFVSINLPRFLLKTTRPHWGRLRAGIATIALALLLLVSIALTAFTAGSLQRLPGETKVTTHSPEFSIIEQSFRRDQSGGSNVAIKIYIENETNRKITIVDVIADVRGNSPIALQWPKVVRNNGHTMVSSPLRLVNSAAGHSPYLEILPFSRSWAQFEGALDRTSTASLRDAIRSNQKREYIQLHITLVRGESFSKPSTFMYQNFVPNL